MSLNRIFAALGVISLIRAASLPGSTNGHQQLPPSTINRNILLRVQVSVDIQVLPSDNATTDALLRKCSLKVFDQSKSYIVTLDDLDVSYVNSGSEYSTHLADSSLQVEQHLVLPWESHTVDGRLYLQGNTSLSWLVPFQAKRSPVLTARAFAVTLWEDDKFAGGSLKPPILLARRLANLPRSGVSSNNRGSKVPPTEQRTASPFIAIHLHGATTCQLKVDRRAEQMDECGFQWEHHIGALASWLFAVGCLGLLVSTIACCTQSGQDGFAHRHLRECASNDRQGCPDTGQPTRQRDTPELCEAAGIREDNEEATTSSSRLSYRAHEQKQELAQPGNLTCSSVYNGSRKRAQLRNLDPRHLPPSNPSVETTKNGGTKASLTPTADTVESSRSAPPPNDSGPPTAPPASKQASEEASSESPLIQDAGTGSNYVKDSHREQQKHAGKTEVVCLHNDGNRHTSQVEIIASFSPAQRLPALKDKSKCNGWVPDSNNALNFSSWDNSHALLGWEDPFNSFDINRGTLSFAVIKKEGSEHREAAYSEGARISRRRTICATRIGQKEHTWLRQLRDRATSQYDSYVTITARTATRSQRPATQSWGRTCMKDKAGHTRIIVWPKESRPTRSIMKPAPPLFSHQAISCQPISKKNPSSSSLYATNGIFTLTPQLEHQAEMMGSPITESSKPPCKHADKSLLPRKVDESTQKLSLQKDQYAEMIRSPRSERAVVSHNGRFESTHQAIYRTSLSSARMNDNHVVSLLGDSSPHSSPTTHRALPTVKDDGAFAENRSGSRRNESSLPEDDAGSVIAQQGKRQVTRRSTKTSRKWHSSEHRADKALQEIDVLKPLRRKRRRFAHLDDLLLPDIVPSVSLRSASHSVHAPVWEVGPLHGR